MRLTWFAIAATATLSLALVSGCGSSAPAGSSGSQPHLVLSVSSLSFGSVQIGQSTTASFSLTNDGDAAAQIRAVQVSGGSFSLEDSIQTPLTVNPGYAYSISVAFAPTGAGAASGSVSVNSNASPATDTVTLSGKGIASPVGPALTLQTSTVAFGNVQVQTTSSQNVTVTSSGTAPLIISKITVAGNGFKVSGATLPLTLAPTNSVTLTISFDPAAAGAVSGSVTIVSNATPAQSSIALSGTGEVKAYQVDLSWNSPSDSKDPVAGYDVFREAEGGSKYQLMNAAPVVTTSYTDTTVAGGTTYKYYVESVDSSGNASAPSNTFTIYVPQ